MSSILPRIKADHRRLIERLVTSSLQINYLDLLIPFASYAKARELYNDLRIQRKDAHDEMKHCAADIQPHETLRE